MGRGKQAKESRESAKPISAKPIKTIAKDEKARENTRIPTNCFIF
jgi:hypothetical protein